MTQRSAWRFFPWIIAAGMSVVIAVNVGMVTAALRTFPGQANGGSGFDLSNRYNAVIDRAKNQAALGWHIDAESNRFGRPVLALADRAGIALTRASIGATAQRPVGEALMTEIQFHETTPGHYVGDVSLPTPGQWDLLLTASAAGQDVTTTRRIVVK